MYCKNCGKPITSIATECPYCHEKVIENNPPLNFQNNQTLFGQLSPNNSRSSYNNLNNRQYNQSKSNLGILGWIGIIIIIISIYWGIENTLYLIQHWYVMTPEERVEFAEEGAKPNTTYTPSTTYNRSTTSTKNYQQIYDDYSQKLINAGPTSSISEMSAILTEGSREMARYMYSASGTDGQYETYQSWANKLVEVYTNNCR